MIENTTEPWLPLELRAEAHTKADRAGVELRRLLTDFCAATVPVGTQAAAPALESA